MRACTTRHRIVGALLLAAAAIGTGVGVSGWAGRGPVTTGTSLTELRTAAVAATDTPAPDHVGAGTPAPVATRDADPAALPEPAPAPVRLTVATLGIDAAVDPVGVEADGSMTVPRSPSRIGWYSYGRAPGDPAGNTVLAGHVRTRAEGPGALAPLREAEIGTAVTVTDAAGTVHRYEVVGVQSVPKPELPADDVFARSGPPLLVVVTCGGDVVPGTGRYSDNVILTAVPVLEPTSAPGSP